MRIGIIGINHKLADLKLREQLAAACQRLFSPRAWVIDEPVPVLLSTCNRTEIYFFAEDLTEAHSNILGQLRDEVAGDYDQKLYSFFGHDCLCHLSRVTAGLDSAIMGETEIQGQVKLAYEAACEADHLPHDLHFLFQKSLKIGKMVRSNLQLDRGVPDVTHTLWKMGKSLFTDPTNTRVLFVGASSINRQICHALQVKGLRDVTLCNRSQSTTRGFASERDLHILPWNRLDEWSTYDWVIVGTKCPHYLIDPSQLPASSTGPKLLLDLSVPRNICPGLADDPRITLWNIDEIHSNVRSHAQCPAHTSLLAEMTVAAAARRQAKIFADKAKKRLLYCSGAGAA